MNRNYLTGIRLTKDFDESAWYDYHQGAFNDADGFRQYFMDYIDNEVIKTWKCKDIVDCLDYDVFAEHDLFGQPKSWRDAGYNALYDHLMETGVTWDEIWREFEEE